MILLTLFLACATSQYKGHRWVKGRTVRGAHKLSTATCPQCTVVARCFTRGKNSEGSYVQDNLCHARSKKRNPIYALAMCVPRHEYDVMVITKFGKGGTVTCPGKTTVADCRMFNWHLPLKQYRIKKTSKTCRFVKRTNKGLKSLSFQATCIEKSSITFTSKMAITEQNFTSGEMCPKGYVMKSCECLDFGKCKSVEVHKSICLVTYSREVGTVQAKVGCVKSHNVKSLVLSGKQLSKYKSFITSCLISNAPDSSQSYQFLAKNIDKCCKLKVKCDKCTVKAIAIIPKNKVLIGKGKVSCPSRTSIIFCFGINGQAFLKNKICFSQGRNYVYAVCSKVNSRVFYHSKVNTCPVGQALIGCAKASGKHSLISFISHPKRCLLFGNIPAFTICKDIKFSPQKQKDAKAFVETVRNPLKLSFAIYSGEVPSIMCTCRTGTMMKSNNYLICS